MAIIEGAVAWFLSLLTGLGSTAQVAAASAFGAFISLSFFEEKKADGTKVPLPIGRKWTIFVSGTFIGIFSAPAVVSLFEVSEKLASRMETFAGLLLACFGMAVVSAGFKVIRETDWSAIIRGKFGG
jgi:hypothetical protein